MINCVDTEKKVCDLYRSGLFIKDIHEKLNLNCRRIRNILAKNNIEVVNVAKRVTPKHAFKKGVHASTFGRSLTEIHGEERAKEISKKISSAREGKTYLEILGSQEKVDEYKEKCKKTRFINKEKNSKSNSEAAKEKWINGVYKDLNQRFNNTKWFEHIRPNGNVVKVQGTWELELAKRLDFLNIEYHCHDDISHRFIYYDKDNNRHSYKPDFQISGTNIYLDPHWYLDELQNCKFEYVKNNYNIKLYILKTIEEVKNFSL